MRVIPSILVATLIAVAIPSFTHAQATLQQDTVTIERAQVSTISNERREIIPGTETPQTTQTVSASILTGEESGKTVTFKNDYITLKPGQVFYLRHTTNPLDGRDFYSVSDTYRLNVLAALAGLFILLIIIFGGIQGIRGFASLLGSIVLIFYVLVPGILHGYDPTIAATGTALAIIILGSYITHGLNKTTSAAILGMIGTVLITGIGAYVFVHFANLTGYSSEESIYLSFDMRGNLDLQALLFGGIMIGLLGVLYDIAIGQAVAVEELYAAGSGLSRRHVYTRGIRIGREHIGALVNTLAIAYVGAALPLLLLVQSSTYDLAVTLNSEIFATEIVRILIGSIGLILAVPITTFIASYLLAKTPHRTDIGSHHHTH